MTAKGKGIALTVIIPVSRVDWLRICIESIHLAVTESELVTEVFLVDTREHAIPDLQNFSMGAKIFRLPGASYGEALDHCKSYVNSDFVALMNDDDLVTTDRFLKQYNQIIADDAEVCMGKLRRLGEMNFSLNFQPFKTFSYDMLFMGPYCANATWFLKAQFFKNLPSINSKNWDWNIALLALNTARVTYLTDVIYLYRQHVGQVTRSPEYRLELFDSVYPQWKESFHSNYDYKASSNVIKAIAFPYLPNDVEFKDLSQILYIFWHMRRCFLKAPIWMAYHVLVRLALFSKNYFRSKYA